jgi:hypothetical protein
MRVLTAVLLLGLCSSVVAQQIPPGTVLPVMLNTTLDARRARANDQINGKITQEVRLPDGATIRKGSRVLGHVISVSAASANSPSRLAFTFDRVTIGGREIPITTQLRAMASQLQVFQAKLPTNSIDDYGTATSDWNTIQIGGAGVYRGNGEVVQGNAVVGHTTDYGAVTAKLMAVPKDGCYDEGHSVQSLWLFSPWACGVYGYSDLKVVKGGGAASPGVIELEATGNVRIDGGSGWLLMANGSD